VPKRGQKGDSLSKYLDRQVAAEIDGDENITNVQKFALQQKYGVTDAVLTAKELQEAELGR
jgi:hypothetical protein